MALAALLAKLVWRARPGDGAIIEIQFLRA
jgi:hypothetical protein